MLYWIAIAFFRCLTAIGVFRVRIEGNEKVWLCTTTILAANHSGPFDPFFISMGFSKKIHYMASDRYFHNRMLAWLMQSVGSFPVRRGIFPYDKEAVQESIRLLCQFEIVCLFAIRHRDKNNDQGKAQTGCSFIAVQSEKNPQIVPIGIDYRPKGLYPIAEVVIKCGDHLYPGFYHNDVSAISKAVTERIKEAQAWCRNADVRGK